MSNDVIIENNFPLVLPPATATKAEIRGFILAVEEEIKRLPNASDGGKDFCTWDHAFAEHSCARTIHVPAGVLVSTAIHKHSHHVFVLKGVVSVFSENGYEKVVAPCSFVSPAGIKRICYIHEDTIWTCVHVTDETDPDKLIEEVTAKSFEEIGLDYVVPKLIGGK